MSCEKLLIVCRLFFFGALRKNSASLDIMASAVGFIGLGIMGDGMVRCLIKAGRNIVVWNRSVAKSEALLKEVCHVATSAENNRRCNQLPQLHNASTSLTCAHLTRFHCLLPYVARRRAPNA